MQGGGRENKNWKYWRTINIDVSVNRILRGYEKKWMREWERVTKTKEKWWKWKLEREGKMMMKSQEICIWAYSNFFFEKEDRLFVLLMLTLFQVKCQKKKNSLWCQNRKSRKISKYSNWKIKRKILKKDRKQRRGEAWNSKIKREKVESES